MMDTFSFLAKSIVSMEVCVMCPSKSSINKQTDLVSAKQFTNQAWKRVVVIHPLSLTEKLFYEEIFHCTACSVDFCL